LFPRGIHSTQLPGDFLILSLNKLAN
jgi:hypothetical protein